MAVPPDEKDDRVIGERGDTVYPLRTKPLTGISAILFPHGASLPQRLPALDRGYDEAQEIGEESPGDPHRPAASICLNPAVPQIEGLVLCNRSSYCYANVTVYALLWHASQSEQGVWIGRQLGRFLGWLLHKPQHLHLCDTRAWPNLVRRWQQPDRQHDAAEFLQLLQWECAPAASEGSWHARIGVVLGDGSHGAQVVDRGHVWPLPLYVADPSVAHLSLQKLFIGWRNQEQRHALVNAPDSLVVQIGRFWDNGDKKVFRVRSSRTVYIPTFSGTMLQTTSHAYTVEAIVYHLGHSRLGGHYRTALLSQGHMVHHRGQHGCTEYH